MIAETPDERRLLACIKRDDFALRCLEAVRDYGPQNAFIAAGFVRNRYWDSLYLARTPPAEADIDVIYFDTGDVSSQPESIYEARLAGMEPGPIWQVRNQARMHMRAGHPPFHGISHAIQHWPETATATALRMNADGHIICLAPFGLNDLYDHKLRITPIVKATAPDVFETRLRAKGWLERWPQLKVVR